VSFLEAATEIAREASALLSTYAERRPGYQLKGPNDLVTEADHASEQLIVERLRSRFPTHSIVGEEGARVEGTSEYCWYVDPLDGTTNFAHGFPVFAVSLGLERAGELVAGVIVDPSRQEAFTAERGAGAYLNHRRIRVSGVARLEQALAATGFASKKRHRNVNYHFFYQLAMVTQGLRRPGAASLDLAWVACGRTDLFWEFALNPWDVAAGVLMVREAGGACTDMRGAPLDLRGPHILADNGRLHQEAVDLFAEVFAGNYRYALPEG
jgi:myo-inositol-1(or 4)-monophosphatase